MVAFFLFNIPTPVTPQKTIKNSLREPLWFLGHLGTQRRFPQFSPIQLSKELNSLKLNSIIFHLRQEKFYSQIRNNSKRKPTNILFRAGAVKECSPARLRSGRPACLSADRNVFKD